MVKCVGHIFYLGAIYCVFLHAVFALSATNERRHIVV